MFRKSSTPAGLYLPLDATVRGRIRWQVLDERGIPEIPRDASGFAVGPIEGVEQPNLITNAGMDAFASLNWAGFGIGTAATMRRYLRVGTGSTAPAFTDTALVAEVENEITSGDFGDGNTLGELDGGTNVWRGTSTVTRLCTMSVDRNLTEFGLSNGSATDLVVRELFRDGGGAPITISLLAGKQIRVDHSFVVELSAPAAGNSATIDLEEYDATETLIGTTPYNVTWGFVAPGGINPNVISGIHTESTQISILGSIWNPYEPFDGEGGVAMRAITAAMGTYNRTASNTTDTDIDPTSVGYDVAVVEPYTPGSYQRTKYMTASAGEGNFDWYGIFFGTDFNSGETGTYAHATVKFDSPTTLTKTNTKTLRAGFTSTWARG